MKKSLLSSLSSSLLPSLSFLSSLKGSLFQSIDMASVAIFRIFFGAVMFWEVCRYFSNSWIERYYIAPTLHFSYYGFSWLAPWPGQGMTLHFILLGLFSLGICLGLFYKISSLLFFLAITYVFLLEQCRYLNHFYLICLISFLMVFIPANQTFSLDHRWKLDPRFRNQENENGPAWALWTLRLQIALVYFFGGVAKINEDWLQGEPIRSWLRHGSDFPLLGPYFHHEWMVSFFTFGGLFFDLFIPFLLMMRPTRIFAFCLTLFFNLINARLFHIGIFPWFMMASSLLFFPPEWPRRFFPQSFRQHSWSPFPFSLMVYYGLIIYFTIQIVMPLRHFLYPGNVHWTEEGHTFSWHMKLRDKESDMEFLVRTTGATNTDSHSRKERIKEWIIDPKKILPRWQWKKIQGRPDLIMQFALAIQKKFHEKGYPNVAVYAYIYSSLNHHPPQLLIDPHVDLTKVPHSLLPSSWILPLKSSSSFFSLFSFQTLRNYFDKYHKFY